MQAGERVTIARAGTPIADLVPHRQTRVTYGQLDLAYSDQALLEADDAVTALLGAE